MHELIPRYTVHGYVEEAFLFLGAEPKAKLVCSRIQGWCAMHRSCSLAVSHANTRKQKTLHGKNKQGYQPVFSGRGYGKNSSLLNLGRVGYENEIFYFLHFCPMHNGPAVFRSTHLFLFHGRLQKFPVDSGVKIRYEIILGFVFYVHGESQALEKVFGESTVFGPSQVEDVLGILWFTRLEGVEKASHGVKIQGVR
jgi:hypothetical protein